MSGAESDGRARTDQGVTILAGDVGGTKTDLSLLAVSSEGGLRPVRRSTVASGEFGDLSALLNEFLDDDPPPAVAALGVPGPVLGGTVRLTNLPWTIDPSEVSRGTGIAEVVLVNDLVAAAQGVLSLGPEDVAVLNPGRERVGHRALVAAGTGLGQAILFWDGARHLPAASEGGHTGFGPRDEEQVALHRFLAARHDRVSWERVVSGPGLESIYEFLVLERGMPASEEVDARVRAGGDLAAAVGDAGIEDESSTCRYAVDLFLRLYGAESANLALTTLALGGIYLWGGIIRKLLPRAIDGPFLEGYLDVGRFRGLLEEIPVRIVLDDRAAIAGAAQIALQSVAGARWRRDDDLRGPGS
ncbi:MAG: glucokinase [Gemmatimonadota bacterium]|jgi:glucokinase